MTKFTKAHAYGNDFLYIESHETGGAALPALARELCERHTGIGADGLIVYDRTDEGASMRLFNADGSRAEVSGNGVRALGAILLQDDASEEAAVAIRTEGGVKTLIRLGRSGSRHTFRAAMGVPDTLRQASIFAAGGLIEVVLLGIGNPHCVVIGPLPDQERFRQLGAMLERHGSFPAGTNVEFAEVERADSLRILIWERGVGPTTSSGTGSCAALVAAAAFGGAARAAEVVAPGGAQHVEWREDGVYLTGWAEILFDGRWIR